MPIRLQVQYPDRNRIDIAPEFLERGSGTIVVDGRDNIVRIEEAKECVNLQLHLSGGAQLRIGYWCILRGVEVHLLAVGTSLTIAKQCGFNGATLITAHEPAHIELGEACLLAPQTSLMASDVHKIYCQQTGERLNPPGDIVVGARVWIATGASVLKNTRIGADSVVGAGSLVSGEFPMHCMLAGVPARVLREGIRWER